MEHFPELISKLQAELSNYEAKPTKASSKRIRDYINQVQKQAVAMKKALIEADKVGY